METTRGMAWRTKRSMLRRRAILYERRAVDLFNWTFPESRLHVKAAVLCPTPYTTKKLCRVLWRDLQRARALPTYLGGRQLRIRELRILFACECWLYAKQAHAVRQVEASLTPMDAG